MAYDVFLADRVKTLFARKSVAFEEKKMMGGLCFMVRDKMCMGIVKNLLMARIDPEIQEEVLTRPGCRGMDFTGRPMKGFLFVEPDGIDRESDLEYWVDLCLEYNPKARSGKKSL
jgi:hypothetical protein